jgi:hypothetical protein
MARTKLPIPSETIQKSVNAGKKAGYAVVEIDLGDGRKITFHTESGQPKGRNEWDDAFDGNDQTEVR